MQNQFKIIINTNNLVNFALECNMGTLISCIIPIYNAEQYLSQCVDSVIAQSFRDWELILVDDGSTDQSGEICDNYASKFPQIRVIHTSNSGVSAARNTGIVEAFGTWLTFVDADDMVHPDCFKILYETVMETGASIVTCDMQEGTKCVWPRIRVYKRKFFQPREAVIDTLYQHHLNSSCCGKLFRKEDILRAGCFVPGLRFEDLESIDRFYMITTGPIVHINYPLYFYRINPNGYMHSMGPGRLDVLRVTKEIENRYANDPELLRAAADRRFSANFNIMLLCMHHGRHEDARQCWKLVRSRRWKTITNTNVRLKNRIGAVAALLGYNFLKLFA